MVKKKWTWQQEDWPVFSYNPKEIECLERDFYRQSGISIGVTKHLSDDDHQELVIELVSSEALNTSIIEGEINHYHKIYAKLRSLLYR